MRLSQKYADHSAELSAIANYITAGDGSPSDDAIRLGISAAEIGMNVYLRIAYENSAGRGPFSLPMKAIVI